LNGKLAANGSRFPLVALQELGGHLYCRVVADVQGHGSHRSRARSKGRAALLFAPADCIIGQHGEVEHVTQGISVVRHDRYVSFPRTGIDEALSVAASIGEKSTVFSSDHQQYKRLRLAALQINGTGYAVTLHGSVLRFPKPRSLRDGDLLLSFVAWDEHDSRCHICGYTRDDRSGVFHFHDVRLTKRVCLPVASISITESKPRFRAAGRDECRHNYHHAEEKEYVESGLYRMLDEEPQSESQEVEHRSSILVNCLVGPRKDSVLKEFCDEVRNEKQQSPRPKLSDLSAKRFAILTPHSIAPCSEFLDGELAANRSRFPRSPQLIRPGLGGQYHCRLVVDAQGRGASRSCGLPQPFLRVEQLGQRPGPLCNASGHRRSRALQRLMTPAKVVIGKVERQSIAKVFPLLAEPIRQTGQPPHAHPHCEILSLDMRCTNLFVVWVPVDWRGDRLGQTRRTVAPSVFGNVQGVNLDELRIIDTLALMPEHVSYGGRISVESIRCQLEFLRRVGSARELLHEARGAAKGALAELMGQHQFGGPIYGDEAPSIADVSEVRFATMDVMFLLEDESPNLIALNVGRWNVVNRCGEYGLAMLTSGDEHLQDRAMMQSRNAGGAANAGAFTDEPDGQQAVVGYEAALSAGFALMRLGITLSASIAPKALQAVAMFAESLTINKTAMAGHLDLDLSSGQGQNERGTRKSLASGFGLRLISPVVDSYRRDALLVSRCGFVSDRCFSGFVVANPRYSGPMVIDPFFLPKRPNLLRYSLKRGVNDGEWILVLQFDAALFKLVLNAPSAQRFSFLQQHSIATFLNAKIGHISPECVSLLLFFSFLLIADGFENVLCDGELFSTLKQLCALRLDFIKPGCNSVQFIVYRLKLQAIPLTARQIRFSLRCFALHRTPKGNYK
jgi:hypothetical protein